MNGEIKCTHCNDTGYVSLPGFSPDMRESLENSENNFLEYENLISTMYRCEFCDAANDTEISKIIENP